MLSDSGEAAVDGGDKISTEVSKKRKLKTPIQVMALENFYNEHKYPTEEMKGKLAEDIGLTEKQVSGWFCHRRLKDKRSLKEDGNTIGSQDRSSVVHQQDRGSGLRQDSCGSTKQTDYLNPKPREVESQRLHGGSFVGNGDDGEDSTSSERSSSLHKNLVSSKDGVGDVGSSRYVARNDVIQHTQGMRSYGYSKPSGYLKVKGDIENVAITAVKRQLGRQYREDGPPLGVEFDPLPPVAFEPQPRVVQEPVYVGFGNQRRSHSLYLTGTRKSINPHSSYESTRKSKMHSPDPYTEDDDDDDDDDDDNMMVGMEPGQREKQSFREPRLKSPSLGYSNPVPDHKSLKETFKGPPREIPLTNTNNSRKSSKSRAEGLRNNSTAKFHNLTGTNIQTNQTHDYGENTFNSGQKTEYLTKSSKLFPLSSSRSPDSMDRGPSSGMVGKYNAERHQKKLHSTNEPPVAKRVKHGYLQQVYAPKSSNSEILGREGQINRSGVESPSSMSGDETEESSSSSSSMD